MLDLTTMARVGMHERERQVAWHRAEAAARAAVREQPGPERWPSRLAAWLARPFGSHRQAPKPPPHRSGAADIHVTTVRFTQDHTPPPAA